MLGWTATLTDELRHRAIVFWLNRLFDLLKRVFFCALLPYHIRPHEYLLLSLDAYVCVCLLETGLLLLNMLVCTHIFFVSHLRSLPGVLPTQYRTLFFAFGYFIDVCLDMSMSCHGYLYR